MVAFATAEQMEARSNGSITASSHPALQRELAAASQAIRNVCGWHIAPVEVHRYQRAERIPSVVFLPAMRITEITYAKVNGITIPVEDVTVDYNTGETNLYGRVIDVSYTSGFALSSGATYAPERLTFSNGSTIDLERSGEIVTATLTFSGMGSVPELQVLPIPARFLPLGSTRLVEYNDPASPTRGITVNEISAAGALGISVVGAASAGVQVTARWVGDPAEVPDVESEVADLEALTLDMVAGSLGGAAEGLAREQAGAVSVTYREYAEAEVSGRLRPYVIGRIP